MRWLASLLLLLSLGASARLPDLDELHFDGTLLRDSNDRVAVLHGYVTIPRLYLYSGADYQRMRMLGVTLQSIEVEPARLNEADYLDRLDQMVLLARRAGMYSLLKMTPTDRSNRFWDRLWNRRLQEEDALLDGWTSLFKRYAQQPAVAGYELLDLPQPGSAIPRTPEEAVAFLKDHLTPFYRAAVDSARRVNPKKLLFFQPLRIPNFGDYPYLHATVDRPNLLFEGHFNPHLKLALKGLYPVDPEYPQTMIELGRSALANHAGLFVSYGLPFNGRQFDRNKDCQAAYQSAAQSWGSELDARMLSGVRPCWADDRSGGNWNVIMGREGLDNEERPWMIGPEARPYPLFIAGESPSFRWDPLTRSLTVRYRAAKEGSTVLVIPRQRTYPSGFVLRDQSGQETRYQGGDMKVTAQQNRVAIQVSWDEDSQRLEISGYRPDTGVRLTLSPD